MGAMLTIILLAYKDEPEERQIVGVHIKGEVVAPGYYEFEYGSTDGKYNRCEVVFEDEKATFYKVSEGVRTAIDSVSTGIKWNEKNNLDYEIKEINNNTHFKVTLNGKLIFSEVIEKCSYGRYMGIYSPDMAVKVY